MSTNQPATSPQDELADFNKARWEELASANVEYSRPNLDLDADSARHLVDPYGVMGDVQGKEVLCLASGGGQQSAAFALLDAKVTVLDLSEMQLERVRIALEHYSRQAALIQGDMRDLSRFGDRSFDLIWQAFSINFVPDLNPVFDEVRRTLRAGGLYHMDCHNPFIVGTMETSWTGEGYLIKRSYADGEIQFDSPYWDWREADGALRQVLGPREFNHTLSAVVNGLIRRGFVLQGVWETGIGDADAVPGSWDHFRAVAPPYLTFWAMYRPDVR